VLLALVFVALIGSGCRTPRTVISQTVDAVGERTIGGRKVREYRARDFRKMDTTDPLLRAEYLPVRIYTTLDASDSIESVMVAGWQEYLWRFSERLSDVDKQYYRPVPMTFVRAGDTATIRWGYPSIEGRDRELRDVVRRRNSYWSIDYYPGLAIASESADELWVGQLRSYPENGGYQPLERFSRNAIYERSLPDSANVVRTLLEILQQRINEAGATNEQ
jgi:hypothetical protein